MKQGDKIYGTGNRLTALDVRFSRFYRVNCILASRILTDLYFYSNFFKNASLLHSNPYKRVSAFLFMEYGLLISSRGVKRWHERMLKNKGNTP